jgi:X-X-X-Leu-X-X-Gly heptad repeat protein
MELSVADLSDPGFRLVACRELLEAHPQSVRIKEQVEGLEAAMPNQPGVAVSFCRTIIETTCKTILNDRGAIVETAWEAPKLVSEVLKHLDLSQDDAGTSDPKLANSTNKLARGVSQLVQGVVEVRNAYGSAAHGADAYDPLLGEAYAEILARATDAVVGLLFKTHLRSSTGTALERFQYSDYPDFDEFIDENFGPFEVFEVPLIASEALYSTDFQAYRTQLVQFQQSQGDPAGQEDESPQLDESVGGNA